MKRVFKVYEEVIFYVFVVITLAAVFILYVTNETYLSIETTNRYIFYILIGIVILLLCKEIIIYTRIVKLKGYRIGPNRNALYVLRLLILALFFSVAWLLINSPYDGYILGMAGVMIKYIMPRPASESIYDTGYGIICKVTYVKYADISNVVWDEFRGISITSNSKVKTISYYNARKSSFLYEFIKEKIEETDCYKK
jgi:hypothetical protein